MRYPRHDPPAPEKVLTTVSPLCSRLRTSPIVGIENSGFCRFEEDGVDGSFGTGLTFFEDLSLTGFVRCLILSDDDLCGYTRP
jgi:hypothetical protein